MLTGSDLLAKVKELGDVSKSDLVRACGYVSTKKNGGERLNFTAFYEALLEAHSNVGRCKKCFNLTSEDECEICKNTERNQKLICVVAETKDLLALERAREFKGLYHVIGGLISPMDSVGPELLEIRSLVERVSKSEIDEIILALTPSVEGDTTSLYIGKLLSPFTKVTRIAYGLPMGSELEYVDEVTLARALEGRTKLN